MVSNLDMTMGCQMPTIRPVISQAEVSINSSVWTAYPEIEAVIPDPPVLISRSDLKAEAALIFQRGDMIGLPKLFVKTMMWGSGKTNGRGPRYTASALRHSDITQLMKEIHEDILNGKIEDAYGHHKKIRGVGPSFHTKLLWVVGSAIGNKPLTPLILDERVWAGLKKIGWNSRKAAGSRDRGKRYRAYLSACDLWAKRNNCSQEDIEFTLFELA